MYRILALGMLAGPNGVSTSMMNLYRHMDKSEVQWDFVMMKEYYDKKQKKGRAGTFEDEILSLGGRTYYVNYDKTKFPRSGRDQLKQIMKADPEIMGVHYHDLGKNTYPLYLAKQMDKPIRIIQFHTSCAKSKLAESNANQNRSQLARLRLIEGDDFTRWACSDLSGKCAYINMPFEVFPNAVDTKRFAYNEIYRQLLRDQLKIPQDALVIGFLATIYDIKNPIFAIKIFEKYKQMYGNVHFVMVGAGKMIEDVREYIKKKHIKKYVHIVGQQKQTDLFYSVFDLFLVPSKSEGFPNTLVEAQDNGCLCLVSDEVDEMVALTDLVEFCSLNEPASKWAEKIHEMVEKAGPRRTWDKEIKAAGYDIEDASKRLVDYYLEKIDEWKKSKK